MRRVCTLRQGPTAIMVLPGIVLGTNILLIVLRILGCGNIVATLLTLSISVLDLMLLALAWCMAHLIRMPVFL